MRKVLGPIRNGALSNNTLLKSAQMNNYETNLPGNNRKMNSIHIDKENYSPNVKKDFKALEQFKMIKKKASVEMAIEDKAAVEKFTELKDKDIQEASSSMKICDDSHDTEDDSAFYLLPIELKKKSSPRPEPCSISPNFKTKGFDNSSLSDYLSVNNESSFYCSATNSTSFQINKKKRNFFTSILVEAVQDVKSSAENSSIYFPCSEFSTAKLTMKSGDTEMTEKNLTGSKLEVNVSFSTEEYKTASNTVSDTLLSPSSSLPTSSTENKDETEMSARTEVFGIGKSQQ